jgi:hypothetical protein
LLACAGSAFEHRGQGSSDGGEELARRRGDEVRERPAAGESVFAAGSRAIPAHSSSLRNVASWRASPEGSAWDEEDRIRAAGLVLPKTGTLIEVEFLLEFLLFTYERSKNVEL